ncbi:hypothetical protein SISSUDRAFT_1122906 [Sistotremastrum suecicum HHB10207 ss-3]|uniref:Uncharacterized protein n=1 Tax=Sistotremastrum suecicum HHB10207 ss-3 TaxID=1314776 RepID=A0A165YMH5_9AGAM|nr:hypothetical protein SISSUDRAFT_1122906 [Sistotremastrum suecicum HHB10207 ss-3]
MLQGKKDRSGTFVLLSIEFNGVEAVHYRLRDLQTPPSRTIPKSLLDSKACICYTHLRFGTPIHPIASAPKKHPPAALAEAENNLAPFISRTLQHVLGQTIQSRRAGRVCVLGGSRSLPRAMDHESLINSDLDNREREWGEEDEYGRLRMGSLAKLMGLMAEAICYAVCMHEAMKG